MNSHLIDDNLKKKTISVWLFLRTIVSSP